jgi:hypothetical protein
MSTPIPIFFHMILIPSLRLAHKKPAGRSRVNQSVAASEESEGVDTRLRRA